MNLEEIRKRAWSLRPDEYPPGDCIASEVTDDDAFFYYGPIDGEYRYRSLIDLYYMKKRKRKEVSDLINVYIDTNYKGIKGRMEYGHFLEWVHNGEVMNVPGDGQSNIMFGAVDDTRNRAFLRATIEAIDRIRAAEAVCVYVPCDYIVSSMEKGLIEQWVNHGWKKRNHEEVKNKDLWLELMNKIKEKGLEDIEWKSGPHKLSLEIVRGIESKYEKPVSLSK